MDGKDGEKMPKSLKRQNREKVAEERFKKQQEKEHQRAVSGYEYLTPKLDVITLQKGYTVSKD